jgi:hypothetical protein
MEAEGQRMFDEMHQIPWLSPENDKRARKIIAEHVYATTLNLRNEKRRAKQIGIGKAAPPVDL